MRKLSIGQTLLVLPLLLVVGCAKSMDGQMMKHDEPDMLAPPDLTPIYNENGKCDPTAADQVGCPCPEEGATRSCHTGPKGSSNVGACHDGTQKCMQAGEFLLWDACGGEVGPQKEDCTTDDDLNCNGVTKCEDSACTGLAGCCVAGDTRPCYDGAPGTAGVGQCVAGTQTCDDKGAWKACEMETIPGAEKGSCTDGIDNDCDGKADCDDSDCAADIACKPPICTAGDKQDCYDGDINTQDVGQCHGGSLICAADGQSWGTVCTNQVLPGVEGGKCGDGIDNDCDGLVDCKDPDCNGDPKCACVPGDVRDCYTGTPGTEDVGACHGGSQTCKSDGSAWGPCVGQVLPSVEAGKCADDVDNDCDGLVDCEDTSCTLDPVCCEYNISYDSKIYATSGTSMYIVNPTDWSETAVGTYGTTEKMTDIAMTPNGEIYTVSSTSLYHINKTTGAASKVITLTGSLNNALTFLPDNRLLAADASGQLKVIDPVAATVTNIGKYGNGYGSSGDLVAVGDGTMFGVSATDKGGTDITTNNLLITVDTASGVATPIGKTGFKDVFGMAYYNSRVIAFTGSGQILEINPVTGAGTLLATHGHSYFGGTVSPLTPINSCE